MKANVSARGYTTVILIINMKRFITQEDDERKRFETLRGKRDFANVLRTVWPEQVRKQDIFTTMEDFRKRNISEAGKQLETGDIIATDQIGFATGVFRSLMLEEYSFPAYAVDKSRIQFSPDLETNFQFKTLFKRVWDRWEIYIRPTFSGFFVIRLTNRYQEKTRSLLAIAQDVLRLQESIDVLSAQKWLEHSRERYFNDPDTLDIKERSVKALLDWVGGNDHKGELLYYPIQWKIAMEVASRFVELIGSEIPMPEAKPINLVRPDPSLSIPLHDSYVIHHFDDVLAEPSLFKKPNGKTKSNAQSIVSLNDIRQSHILKRTLVNLIEGSLLRSQSIHSSKATDVLNTQTIESTSYFPNPKWSLADNLFELNQASWNDEFCLLGARTALIIPSQEWKNSEISVSTVPSSTLHVKYLRYWGAIERMVEFVIEIRVLSQLIESESYDLLREIAQTVHETRSKLFTGDIKLDQRLPDLVTRAAYLRHLAALSQSLSHPQLWSRAEYAIQKATYLLEQLGVPTILEHIERNITSISSVVDHVDELYLADLSEKENDNSTILSLGLAAASLTLTLLMLPSFWADIKSSWGDPFTVWQWMLAAFGIVLSICLIAGALYMLRIAFIQRKKVKKMFDKFLEGTS
ncbi:MAG TPA: hypothetical protein VFQ23_06760 [Anaerolineales bacterium]|nr:hypothetical protein [Anaerolineales bacterium]